MPLPSFLKPKDKKPAPRRAAAAAAPADDSGPVQQARTRARRRLIGAVVLLAVGVIGFPLIFETQPRPVALDIPIEAPPSARAGTAAAPAPRPAALPSARASAPVVAAAPAEVIEEAPPPKTTAPAPAPAPAPSVAAPAPKPAAPPPVAKADDSSRAKALLEDAAPKPAPAAGRFVVQVGAFSDGNALREARQKVEKIGLKTYTQVVETEAGKRTRVRVGPFATRDEADSVGAKLKAAGLPAAVLTL